MYSFRVCRGNTCPVVVLEEKRDANLLSFSRYRVASPAIIKSSLCMKSSPLGNTRICIQKGNVAVSKQRIWLYMYLMSSHQVNRPIQASTFIPPPGSMRTTTLVSIVRIDKDCNDIISPHIVKRYVKVGVSAFMIFDQDPIDPDGCISKRSFKLEPNGRVVL